MNVFGGNSNDPKNFATLTVWPGMHLCVYLIGLILSCFGAVLSMRDGEVAISLLFVILLVIPLLLLVLYTGRVEASTYSIRYKNAYGVYELLWDEIKTVGVDRANQYMVFSGNQKRLSIPGPLGWVGREPKLLKKLLDERIAANNIVKKRDAFAAYKFPKNVRRFRDL